MIGFGAVLLWSMLAVLTVLTDPVPAFLLNGLTFGIGGLASLGLIALRGGLGRLRGLAPGAILFGVAGLFLYHALYFAALRLAPPAEAGLINYLWPLLIVLMSGMLPGERLRRVHVIGAVAAFAGAALVVLKGGGDIAGTGTAWLGLLLAGLAAFTWAIYSLGSRRFGNVPTEAVVLYCIGTSVLSVICHLVFETTVWPAHAMGWWALLALGLGPVGLAFFLWDVGVKRGDIQLLGVSSYCAPLLSTLALVVAGMAPLSVDLLFAALLIVLGAVIASCGSRIGAAEASGTVAAPDALSRPD